MQLPEINLPVELAKLRERGWIQSKRKSDTGIGKTIEDLLGIKENNQGQPDCVYQGNEIEIKCHRLRSDAMITLFTLEPGIRHLNDVQLMQRYGYKNGNGRQALKITLATKQFTPQGLKLESDPINRTISIVDTTGYKPWVWTISDIRLKLHNLCIISADSKKERTQEYFRVQRAILAIGLNDECFFRLVAEGFVKIDLRMHMKESGASRNHGTGFRLPHWEDIIQCYDHQEVLLE